MAKPKKFEKLKKIAKKAERANIKKDKREFKVIIFLSIFFMILLAVVLFYKFSLTPETVKVGDKVSVKYVGSFENGTIFDTNIKEVAESAGTYNPKRGYIALKFKVGAGQMIAGFDEAIVGMKIGEEKTVIIPPKKAYGEYNPNLTFSFPMIKEIPLYDKLTRGQVIHTEELSSIFNVSTVKVNDTLPATEKYRWPLLVTKIGTSDLNARLMPNLGDRFEEGSFNYTIISMTDSEITVRRKPATNILPSKFGELMVNEENGKIVSKYNLSMGSRVKVGDYLYYIASQNGTDMFLDGNNPLAGKTLVFKINVSEIEPAQPTVN